MTVADSKKIKVLVVDDSSLIRKILPEILAQDSEIEVVGTASNPYVAREKIKLLNPDVLTLDVEMPKMDGITFLANLMRLRPMPVVMVSSLTETGADVTLQALELGAVDFVSKPKIDIAEGLMDYSHELISKVKAASRAKLRVRDENFYKTLEVSPKYTADAVICKSASTAHYRTTEQIIAIGASTGGTEAIKELLQAMTPDMPGIVITQHIPEKFSSTFARRMDSISAMKVCEAEDGQHILTGHVYIAPGDKHLLVERAGMLYVCRLNDGPPVNRHRPSVDVLFRSVALCAGPNAIGVMLTGMGNDGAIGMKEMHDAGAKNLAQDERSSVVWGMPGEAVKLGGVDEILALDKIVQRLSQLIKIES